MSSHMRFNALSLPDGVFISRYSDIGKRESMEDYVDVRPINCGSVTSKPSDGTNSRPRRYMVTVCDGHGGTACASFASKRFPDLVVKTLQVADKSSKNVRYRTVLNNALKQVVKEWDLLTVGVDASKVPVTGMARKRFFENAAKRKQYDTSGTTLVSAILDFVKCEVVIMNLGDSRAQWCIKGTVSSTVDHKPSKTELVKYPGARVQQIKGDVPRINGELAVGRAIGNNSYELLGSVPRNADVTRFKYQPNESLDLVLATDGLWDEQNGHKLILETSKKLRPTPVRSTVRKTLKLDSTNDNISVVGVSIRPVSRQ